MIPIFFSLRNISIGTLNLFDYLSSKKKNLPLLYSHVTYLYIVNYTYSP